MIKRLPKVFPIFAFFLIFNCGNKSNYEQVSLPNSDNIRVKTVHSFTYVSIEFPEPVDSYKSALSEFMNQMEQQQIIPTGPIFIAYPRKKADQADEKFIWEIGCPTAEGTMVKDPMILKKWPYRRVASVEYASSLLRTRQTHNAFRNLIQERNLLAAGPTVYRLLSFYPDIDSLTMNTLQMEVWVPLYSSLQLSE